MAKRDPEYNKRYYQKNKQGWNKRTPEENAKRNEERRTRYATDAKFRESIKGKVRQYNASNRQKRKAYAISKNYGLSQVEYDKILDLQLGVCAICEREPQGKGIAGLFHVDHDHETGKVRGLLCTNCNQGLGKFKDSKRLLVRAYLYLESQGGNQ